MRVPQDATTVAAVTIRAPSDIGVANRTINVPVVQAEKQRKTPAIQPSLRASLDRVGVAPPVSMAGLVLDGRVVDARGRPLVGWEISGWPAHRKGGLRDAETDAKGRFRLARCANTDYRIRVYPAGKQGRVKPTVVLRGVRPGEDELLIQVADSAVPSAVIEGRLLGVDGRPLAGGFVRIQSDELGSSPIRAFAEPQTGRFRAGPIHPGRYRLQGSSGNRRSRWTPLVTLYANRTVDVGVLSMCKTGTLQALVRDAKGKPLDGVYLCVVEAAGELDHAFVGGETSKGVLRVEGLAPGSYRLRASGRNLPTVFRPFTIKEEQETKVEMVVPSGVRCSLMFSSPTEAVPMHLRFHWVRNTTSWRRYDHFRETRRALRRSMVLLPGNYEITVTSETGQQRRTQFVIQKSDPAGKEIRVILP